MICDSHLTSKVANKCLNVREWVDVVEWNKRWSPPFPCSPVSCQCPSKKTLIEKKLICRINQWTGFYMIRTSIMKELKEINSLKENAYTKEKLPIFY